MTNKNLNLKIICIEQNEKNKHLAEKIEQLNISSNWKELFLKLCYSRGISTLTTTTKTQLINIGQTDSKSVYRLAQFGKKVGLEMLERLSLDIENENIRQKAVNLLFKQNVKTSKHELELIISEAKQHKNLFDFAD